MMELYLVRHGQSEGNAARVNEGWANAGLTELGTEQARLVAERFEHTAIDRIISSDLRRARETAEAIAQRKPDVAFETREDLREWNLGVYEGTPYGAIFEKMDRSDIGRLDYPIEGGETIRSFKERVQRAIDDIVESHQNEIVIVVSHGGFILNALLHLLEMPDERFSEFDPENTGVAHLVVTDTVTAHYLNDVRHLEGLSRSGFSTFQEQRGEDRNS